jgi:hypothetical protein
MYSCRTQALGVLAWFLVTILSGARMRRNRQSVTGLKMLFS